MAEIVPLTRASLPAQSDDALALLRQHSDAWQPEAPAPLDAATCGRALEAARGRLVPCDVETATVLVDRTLALWTTPDNWDEIAEFYLEAVEDLPRDVLEAALKHVRLTHRFNFPPKPADIRAAAQPMLAERRHEHLVATLMARRAEEDERSRAEAEECGRRWREDPEAMLSQIRGAVRDMPR